MQKLHKGDVINKKYEIVAKHGSGTLGTIIYLGYDLQNKCDVLVRVLNADFLSDEEMVARFMQGVALLKKLKHPNILSVVDAGEEKGVRYLITEFKKGFFLNEYLEHRGQLDEKEAVRLIKSLAEALEYAWQEQKVIHRNISPDTIFVAKGNIPMLTDFDLAKSLTSDVHLTLQGMAIGDPLYMSPEQAKGEKVDFRSDIYCLGLVFYQLLAGVPPFSDKSKMEILKAQVAEKHEPVSSKNRDVSPECSDVLDRMLVKNATERYESWPAVIKALDDLLCDRKKQNEQARDHNQLAGAGYKMQAVSVESSTLGDDAVQGKPAAVPEATRKGFGNLILLLFVVLLLLGGVFFVLSSKTGTNIKVTPKNINQPLLSQNHNVKVSVQKKSVPAPDVPVSSLKVPDCAACINNIKQISVALDMYANVFDGKYPAASGAKGLNELVRGDFLSMSQVFICPETGHVAAAPGDEITEDHCDYVYVGGLTEYSDPKTPILWSKPENHKDYGIILYVNGKIEPVSGSNWLSKTKKMQKKF